MTKNPIEDKKKVFITGNEVVVRAALAAEAAMLYGYPITPQNEIMHYWTKYAPEYNRDFLQTEDEISAGFYTIGAVLGGVKAFSATAGPGNTLFQEPMSMAEMMRIPTVSIITQRGGPSTATVIYSQQEVTMTCFGANGEGFRIVYSTADHQELYDYTIKAFNTAWKYRFPTFVLGDGYQAKMKESVELYNPEKRGVKMIKTKESIGESRMPGIDRAPVHLRNTYNTEEELYEVVMDLAKNYEDVAPEITEYQSDKCDDAEIVLISHGIVFRAVREAAQILRKKGIKAGYFRPITLRPFPEKELKEKTKKVKKIIVVESAYGQLKKLITDSLFGSSSEILELYKPGMGLTSDEIIEKTMEEANVKCQL